MYPKDIEAYCNLINTELGFINLEAATKEYTPATKEKIKTLTIMYYDAKRRAESSSNFPVFFQYPPDLRVVLRKIKTLSDDIIKYPDKYHITSIIKEKAEFPLTTRSRSSEINYLACYFSPWVDNYPLTKLHENLNWFSDQKALHHFPLSTQQRVNFLIEQFQKLISENKKKQNHARLVRIAKQVERLAIAMTKNPSFYLMKPQLYKPKPFLRYCL